MAQFLVFDINENEYAVPLEHVEQITSNNTMNFPLLIDLDERPKAIIVLALVACGIPTQGVSDIISVRPDDIVDKELKLAPFLLISGIVHLMGRVIHLINLNKLYVSLKTDYPNTKCLE